MLHCTDSAFNPLSRSHFLSVEVHTPTFLSGERLSEIVAAVNATFCHDVKMFSFAWLKNSGNNVVEPREEFSEP